MLGVYAGAFSLMVNLHMSGLTQAMTSSSSSGDAAVHCIGDAGDAKLWCHLEIEAEQRRACDGGPGTRTFPKAFHSTSLPGDPISRAWTCNIKYRLCLTVRIQVCVFPTSKWPFAGSFIRAMCRVTRCPHFMGIVPILAVLSYVGAC